MHTDVDVLIIGGGIAGLSCSWELKKKGIDHLLIEASPRLGGRIRSEQCGPYLIEHGPHTFLGRAENLFALAEELSLSDELIASHPAAFNRYLVKDAQAHRVPSSVSSFIKTPLLSWPAKLRLLYEPWAVGKMSENDSVLDFFQRRLGAEAGTLFAHAFVAGVYAGRPDCLSASAALPMLWSFERNHKSLIKGALKAKKQAQLKKASNQDQQVIRRKGLFSFRDGLETLCQGLARATKEHHETLRPARSIQRWSEKRGFVVETDKNLIRAKQLVIATPPHPAGNLCQSFSSPIKELLHQIPMASVAGVYLGYSCRQITIPDAFGCLAPQDPAVNSLGILLPSRIFPCRSLTRQNSENAHSSAKGDLITAYLGGMVKPELFYQKSDDDLKAALQEDLANLFHVTDEPDWYRIERWKDAIPQFDLHHPMRVKKLLEHLKNEPTLHLAGNYLNGVGIPDASVSGQRAAEIVTCALGAQ